MLNTKAICHFDVDSFYCGCECIRRPELRDKPFAVSQFNSGGFVSVNNVARKHGIRKGDGIGRGGQRALKFFQDRPDAVMSEVRKRCPSLVVLPMDTVWYRSVSDKIEKALKSKLKSEFDRRFGQKNRKVNPHYFGTVEKSSIDDFFVDITNFVEQLLVSNDATSPNEALDFGSGNTQLYELDGSRTRTLNCAVSNKYMQYSSQVASMLRLHIEKHVGVTLSGGISSNKLIARLISKVKGEVNVQSSIEPRNIIGLLKNTKIKNVPGFKSQFGSQVVEDLKVETLFELQKFTYLQLMGRYGEEKANLICNYSRGEDPSVVVERPPLKSFMTESSFAPVDVNSSELLQQKISSIITSFVDRLLLESRIPCLLTITYRHSYEKPVSKSFKFPKLNIFKMFVTRSNASGTVQDKDRRGDETKLFNHTLQTIKGDKSCKKLTRLALTAGKFNEDIRNQKSVAEMFLKMQDGPSKGNSKKHRKLSDSRQQLPPQRDKSHFKCNICNKMIEIHRKQEHEDFHYAMKFATRAEHPIKFSHVGKKRKKSNTSDIRNWF